MLEVVIVFIFCVILCVTSLIKLDSNNVEEYLAKIFVSFMLIILIFNFLILLMYCYF